MVEGDTIRFKVRVGPKGQAVIPKPVRYELGIHPGDEVYFSTHAGHAQLEKGSRADLLRAFFASLPDRRQHEHLKTPDLKRLRDEQYEEDFGAERSRCTQVLSDDSDFDGLDGLPRVAP